MYEYNKSGEEKAGGIHGNPREGSRCTNTGSFSNRAEKDAKAGEL